ncbi:MerR family transcriptional regulator [Massilia sp. Root351]|jgi:DNA-binding transcriptional MerR regulator|uniref:MerR family transcriptional regulator n=1 Tax=Massilia sp. Root351 TaxID=1736522 RepID=UPI00070D7013|nr:MerR family transcriptional regulator [Massilia sp. Root351]KQV90045.1 MerR family transcriptional regulator [Massilia sp. Root351]
MKALRIGELAARSGLTVRALHHYDSIGLLRPSARADSGHRLYNRDDAARLHQILALRKFGMALADIGTLLASPDAPFAGVVAQQIEALDRQIAQASALRAQLTQLQRHMDGGGKPELEDWLATLEHMHLYEQYFSQEELRRLPFWQQDARRNQAWATLVTELLEAIARGLPAAAPEAGALAQRWMQMLEDDTGGDPEFAWRMTRMLEQEASAQRLTRITPELKQYVAEAWGAHRLALYAKYLHAAEVQHMREHGGKHFRAWMALIVTVHRHMASGIAAHEPSSQGLAAEWMRLFHLRCGGDPATLERIRLAHEREPALLKGTWVSAAMLDYIRAAQADFSG